MNFFRGCKMIQNDNLINLKMTVITTWSCLKTIFGHANALELGFV